MSERLGVLGKIAENKVARTVAAVTLTVAVAKTADATVGIDPITSSAESASHLVINSPQKAYETAFAKLAQKFSNAKTAEAGDPDSDLDGFSDIKETYIGTNPNSACGKNAFPPDLDNDGQITILDLAKDASAFGSSVANGDPRYDRKKDMDADRTISILDLSIIAHTYGKTCTGMFPYPANFSQPPNGDFEVADYTPGKPIYWVRQWPTLDQVAVYHDHDGIANTGTSSSEVRFAGSDTGSGCNMVTSGWDTNIFTSIDSTKKYTEQFFAEYSQDATTTIEPYVFTFFYDASGVLLATDDHIYTPQPMQNQWDHYTRTFGPGADVAWPAGTAKIKIRLLENGSSTTTCTNGAVFGYVRYDGVEVIESSLLTPTPTATFTSTSTATPTATPTP